MFIHTDIAPFMYTHTYTYTHAHTHAILGKEVTGGIKYLLRTDVAYSDA